MLSMASLFSKRSSDREEAGVDFSYMSKQATYFDSACTTLRPQPVIEAEVEYYQKYNSCGHRVNYRWGQQTDRQVDRCREAILEMVKHSSTDYSVAFNLNTTMGINQLLFQLPVDNFNKIVTSEIEHNSVFLPSITWSQRFSKERLVLPRKKDGSLAYQVSDLARAVVIINSTSNIHGVSLANLQQLIEDTHAQGGIVLIDACQTFGHQPELLEKLDFDAAFGSGHKMYAPSVGFTIIKKELLESLEPYLLGGSTVAEVYRESYELISGEEKYARLEPGLQNYGGIIGLEKAIRWRREWRSQRGETATQYEHRLAEYLHEKLQAIPHLQKLPEGPSGTVSMYLGRSSEELEEAYPEAAIEGHKLSAILSQAGIMGRSGYHCCHYYLQQKLQLPPLFRISLGLNNSMQEIDELADKLEKLSKQV